VPLCAYVIDVLIIKDVVIIKLTAAAKANFFMGLPSIALRSLCDPDGNCRKVNLSNRKRSEAPLTIGTLVLGSHRCGIIND